MSTALWSPSTEQIESSQIYAFARHLEQKFSISLPQYEELYEWSIAESEDFWAEVWEFGGVRASVPWTSVRSGASMQSTKWFEGARLNFAENLLRFNDEHPAIVFRGEDGKKRSVSYQELQDAVSAFAGYLSSIGVGVGDRVAAFIPNIPEAIIGMLAASKLGAIWSSCSPDFGVEGVYDRFGQIEPKVLITADGYSYNGKVIDSLGKVEELLTRMPSVERSVVIPFLRDEVDSSVLPNAVLWEAALGEGKEVETQFAQLPFDHPLYIMFSSGTTGVPKCIVHGAGGTLLQHLKEHLLHVDLRREDVLFYQTTCGWMMWNWLVSGLAVGASLALYEGAPFYPDAATLFDYADDIGITVFGTSAKYLSAVEKSGICPKKSHSLASVRAITSTGSTLMSEQFDYVYENIKEDVLLGSITGGTDIVSLFAGCCPIRPVYRGELQCRCLGMKVEIFDDQGTSLIEEQGELVCTDAFPCMPIYFWNDPDGKKYHDAYFDTFENVWRHGDWSERTAQDGVVIYGRSDATLNPGGVRIGTSDIYRQVESFSQIKEAIAVGQDWEGDTRVVLFVVMQDGELLGDELIAEIRAHIRSHCSPRHMPAKVIAVPEIPRTRSGKIVELAVRNVIHGRAVKNQEALLNPEALRHFEGLEALNAS